MKYKIGEQEIDFERVDQITIDVEYKASAYVVLKSGIKMVFPFGPDAVDLINKYVSWFWKEEIKRAEEQLAEEKADG